MISYLETIKHLVENNPKITEECNIGLAIFKDTVFDGLVEAFLMFDDPAETVLCINYYPKIEIGKHRIQNLFKRYLHTFSLLKKQADRFIIVKEI